jgi:phage shock protein PspC (stress-responsive transcriptional regulator)
MKTFYRSSSDNYIAGICGGLGEYTGIDPLIWRAIFLFAPGTFWIYMFIWFFSQEE